MVLVALIVGMVVLAAFVGVDTRDGRDWQPPQDNTSWRWR